MKILSMKRIFVILFISLSVNALAQKDSLSFELVDKATLYYYNTGNWQALITLGKKAQRQGIDYYYLNYRLGTAYFMTENYMMSAEAFERAVEQNEGAVNDTVLVKMLMLDYLYTKNFSKAEMLKKYHPRKETRDYKFTKAVSQLYLEGGRAFVQNIENKAVDERKFYYFKQYDRLKDLRYINFDIQGFVAPGLSYQLAFSGLNLDRFQFFKEFPDTFLQDYSIKQSYLYAGINYRKGNFFINPAVNLPGYNSKEIVISDYDSLTGRNIYDTVKLVSRNLVLALRTGYYYRKMRFSIFGSISNMHDSKQYQAGAGFLYMPLGNLDLYFHTQLTGHWEGGIAYLTIRQKAGFKLAPFLWSELQFTIGNLHDYAADNGYYIYNTYDKINSITDLNLLFLINKHLELDLVLQYLWKENVMYSYPSKFNTEIQTTNYYFQQFNLIGGIKWKF